MSIIDIFRENPWLIGLAATVILLVALGAYKMVKEFFPW